MQNTENIESDQSSCHLVSPCYTSWWNAIRSESSKQSRFRSLNLYWDSHAHNLDTKQLHHQVRDSSLTLSNNQSRDGSKVQLTEIQNELSNSKESGCDETHKKSAENCVKSTIPFGTSEIISQAGRNYAHSATCLSFPYADPYYGAVLAAYGSQAILHPQMPGMATARVPLPSYFSEEEPIYVNPKQYHGILRRRQHRAKLEVQNKLVKNRKPYLHESRHLHAMKRVRGSGGRFLNTRELQQCNPTSSTDDKKISTSSSLLHVGEDASILESDNANTGTSTPSGSDLTSLEQ